MKKVVVLMGTVIALFCAQAATGTANGIDWEYRVLNGGASMVGEYSYSSYYPTTASISKFTSGAIIVPDFIDEYPVTDIGEYAFYNCSLLTSVTIPYCITNIGHDAFCRCSSLTNIVIPNSIISIGNCAFQGCSSLTDIEIPNSVTDIGFDAFCGCTSLTNAVFLGKGLYNSSSSTGSPFYNCSNLVSVTTTDTCAYMFEGCNKMKELVLLDGVQEIKRSAFYNCKWMTEIEIPNSVTNLDRYAFYNCSELQNVRFTNPDTRIPYWINTSTGEVLDYPFDGCNSIVDVTIPQSACSRVLAKTFPASYQSITNVTIIDGVTRIAAECFKNCFELKRIVIPASVSVIYDNAFQNCSALEEIVFLGDAPDVGSDILLGTPRSLKITVKEGSVGWNGGVSTELPEAWPVGDATARGISYYDDSADVAAMTPVITPADGSIFADTCEVSISCAMEGAKIYYRTDGKTPKFTDAYLYKGAFTISDTSKIVAVAVKEGVENGFATATLTKRVLTLAEAAGDADLTFTTGGAADWVPIGDLTAADGVSARSGAVGDEEESWMELSVSGSGTLTFNWKVSCEDDPVSATWDHLAVFVDGKEREDLCFDGETGWENASIVLDSDGVHTVRWVYVKDESDSEGADCAWISSVNWAPTLSGDITVDIGDDKNVVVPVSWIDKYDSIVTAAGGDKAAALQRTAANGRKVWECFMLGLDPTKEDDDFKITRFWMENGKPMFEFSRSVDGAGNSFVPRIKAKGKANLTDSWSDVPDGGDPSFRFFMAEVVLP